MSRVLWILSVSARTLRVFPSSVTIGLPGSLFSQKYTFHFLCSCSSCMALARDCLDGLWIIVPSLTFTITKSPSFNTSVAGVYVFAFFKCAPAITLKPASLAAITQCDSELPEGHTMTSILGLFLCIAYTLAGSIFSTMSMRLSLSAPLVPR